MKYIETSPGEHPYFGSLPLPAEGNLLDEEAERNMRAFSFAISTGVVDAKIWEPGNPGIGDFEELDYVSVDADVILYNNKLQLKVSRIRRANEDEYNPGDYMPVSRGITTRCTRNFWPASNRYAIPISISS